MPATAAAAAAAAAPEHPLPAAAAGANGARALRALNLMATGVMTQDDALLRGVACEEAFASRVRDVAASQPPSARPDPASMQRLVDELLPLVRRLNALPDGDDSRETSSNPSASSHASSSVAAAPGAEAAPQAQEAPRQNTSQAVATSAVRLSVERTRRPRGSDPATRFTLLADP